MRTFMKFFSAMALGILTALSMPGFADDTELYRGQVADINETDVPNVVFMLDRSGSMDFYLDGGRGAATCNLDSPPGDNCNRMSHLQYALKQLINEVSNVRLGFMSFKDEGHKKQIPVNYPVTDIDAPASALSRGSSTEKVSSRVADSADDAEEFTTGANKGNVSISDKVLQLTGSDGNDEINANIAGGDYNIYLRFDNGLNNIMRFGHEGAFEDEDGNLKTPTFAEGISGQAIKFTGNGDHVHLPALEELEVGEQGAIAFWYKKLDTANNDIIFVRDKSGSSSYKMFFNSNRLIWTSSWQVFTEDRYDGEKLHQIKDTWMHVVATGNKNKMDMYINGQLVNSFTNRSFDDSEFRDAGASDWYFGSWKNGNNAFNGLLDEFILDDEYWDGNKVMELYSAGLQGLGGSSVNYKIESRYDDAVTYIKKGTGNNWRVRDVGDFHSWNKSQDYNALTLGNGQCTNSYCVGEALLGLRFPNIATPAGATLQAAKLKLYVDKGINSWNNEKDDVKSITISAEANPKPEPFKAAFHNRPHLSETVVWEDVPLEDTIEVDVTSVVNAAITQTGWDAADNAVALYLKKTPGSGDWDGSRYIYSDEKSSSKTAELELTFGFEPIGGGGGSGGGADAEPVENQVVGFRFQNVDIPQGAEVVNAQMALTSLKPSSGGDTYIITVERSPNALPFQQQANNLSSRPRHSASIEWTPEAWGTASTVTTPDLSSLIQEVVGPVGSAANNWCGGNAINLFIEPKGDSQPLRSVLSYDGAVENDSPNFAPTLDIEYSLLSVPNEACVTRTHVFQIENQDNDALQTPTRGGVADDNTMFHIADNPASVPFSLANTGAIDNRTTRIVGLRFENLTISSGVDVREASLKLTAASQPDTQKPVTLMINAEAGDSAAFEGGSSNKDNLGKRAKTASSIEWAPGDWTKGEVYSVDVTDPVKEVLGAGDWSRFNSLSLFIQDTQTRTADEEPGYRVAESFESSAGANPAILSLKVAERYADNADSVRKELLEWLPSITTGGSTPLVPALLETANYYTGGKLYYGDHRAKSLKNQVSHPASYAGGGMYLPDTCTLEHLDDYGYNCSAQVICTADNGDFSAYNQCKNVNYEKTETVNYIHPPFSPCQPNYMIFLTDGEANGTDTYAKDEIKRITGKSSCSTSGTHKSKYANDEQCGKEIIEYMYNNDFDPDMAGLQNIITYTIGFLEADPDLMTDWAEAGGGKFYPASDATSLLDAFHQILTQIKTQSTSFAAPTLSVNAFNKLFHNEDVYFALFKPEMNQIWNGNVKKYKLCDGNTDSGGCCEGRTPEECVGEVLDAEGKPATGADDKIVDNAFDVWNFSTKADGSVVTRGGAGQAFFGNEPNQGPGVGNRKIYSNLKSDVPLSNPQNEVTMSNTTNALFDAANNDRRSAVINWLQGYQNGDANGDAREWTMGDPLHSSPGAITFDVDHDKVYVATNEGAIRQIDAETGYEDWAFIPKDLLSMQEDVMKNITSSQRLYGIDGTPAFWVHDLNRNGKIETSDGDFVRLYIGMRRGGRSVYALDVSDPEKPKFMWQIKGGSGRFSNLGQTWSLPRPTQIEVGGKVKTVLMFGAGYDPSTQDMLASLSPANQGNGIFIVDAETGDLILEIGDAESSSAQMKLTGMQYSIPSDLALMDSDGDGLTDRIYVGDTGGQVWRVDLKDVGTLSRGASLGGRLANLANPDLPQQMRRFFYAPDVVQMNDSEFSAEPLYDLVLISSGYRPGPLSRIVTDRLYALRDRAVLGLKPSTKPGSTASDAEVDDAGYVRDSSPVDADQYGLDESSVKTGAAKFFTLTHNEEQGGSEGAPDLLYDATKNLVQDEIALGDEEETTEQQKLRVRHGWFVDLPDLGEKSLASPMVLEGKVFFTAFVPPGASEEVEKTPEEEPTEGRTYDDPKADPDYTCPADKVKFCHSPPGNPKNSSTLCLPLTGGNSVASHLANHPFDHMGACAPYDFERSPSLATGTCETQEGHGRIYALSIYSAGSVMNFSEENDLGDTEVKDATDRSKNLGEGIPSEVLPVFMPKGVALLTGTGGGINRLPALLELPRDYVYWFQE